MIRRSTWILLGAFVVVVGLAWYIQSSQDREAALATEPPGIALLFPIQSWEIISLQISDAQGEAVEVRRNAGGEWILVGLEQGEPDLDRIERAITNASGIRILSELESVPALEVIGLNPPQYRIAITLESGASMQVLIGNLTAMENGYYAHLEGEQVVIANKFNIDAILEILQESPVLPEPEQTPEPDEGSTVEP
jgi:hypothetical protein